MADLDKRSTEEIEKNIIDLFGSVQSRVLARNGFSGFLEFLEATVEAYHAGADGLKPNDAKILHRAGARFMEGALSGLKGNLDHESELNDMMEAGFRVVRGTVASRD